ncbi:MAG: carbohydrate kinase [Chitinophagaceae bacterium]|uniref:carbohydrate kinase family protein n=1 Tax=unclassified Paraflavitalea TaxID=2798305 RepID=UPI003D3520E1|nr:carbohydrate kinase [Chitinophagaceae bacterium]
MKILCIGEALIDMICTDKGKPLSEGNNFLKKAGGAPTNVAAAIAALGGQASLSAKVGIDPFGKHLMDVMQSFQVNTDFVHQDKDHFTTFAFVSLMENGERDFYFNRGADSFLSEEEINQIPVTDFSIIHFGSATAFLPGPLQSAYKLLLQKAKQAGVFVSFDPNYRHLLYKDIQPAFIAQSWHFLNQCDFFKVSDEEAMLLTATDNVTDAAAALLQKTTAVFAITLGKEGTLLGMNGTTQIISSIPIKPVDTTGAGDAFVGALLYQLSGLTATERAAMPTAQWVKLIQNSNKAGARTCEYMGAMEAFKHLSNDIFL